MLEKELSEAITDTKQPQSRLIIILSILCVISMASAVVFLFKSIDNSKTSQFQECKQEIIRFQNTLDKKDEQISRLKDYQYQQALQQVKEFKAYSDSINKELHTITYKLRQ